MVFCVSSEMLNCYMICLYIVGCLRSTCTFCLGSSSQMVKKALVFFLTDHYTITTVYILALKQAASCRYAEHFNKAFSVSWISDMKITMNDFHG